jgi:hypothetical protein
MIRAVRFAKRLPSHRNAIAMGIALQPVPEDMARLVHIMCYDCEGKDRNRRWHFLGVRCNHCMSFNTNVEHIECQGRDAALFLDLLEARQASLGTGIPTSIVTPDRGMEDRMEEDAPSTEETMWSSDLGTGHTPDL